jgi:predicted  nucleic acid-binding Zn-ribbon protein
MGTTAPGYVNRNDQTVLRATGQAGTDHRQFVYVLSCRKCGHVYGANGSDIFLRKCPECQRGAPGLGFQTTPTSDHMARILRKAKALAREYYAATGRPLGITGEIAEYEAVRLLDLEIAPVRSPGYDAVRRAHGRETRIQVKGRCILPGAKPGQRLGRIDLTKEFDSVVLVLLDQDFNATAIYEATREAVVDALSAAGSKARNERGALGLSKFKAIGRLVWSRSTLPPAASGSLPRSRRIRARRSMPPSGASRSSQ